MKTYKITISNRLFLQQETVYTEAKDFKEAILDSLVFYPDNIYDRHIELVDDKEKQELIKNGVRFLNLDIPY